MLIHTNKDEYLSTFSFDIQWNQMKVKATIIYSPKQELGYYQTNANDKNGTLVFV